MLPSIQQVHVRVTVKLHVVGVHPSGCVLVRVWWPAPRCNVEGSPTWNVHGDLVDLTAYATSLSWQWKRCRLARGSDQAVLSAASTISLPKGARGCILKAFHHPTDPSEHKDVNGTTRWRSSSKVAGCFARSESGTIVRRAKKGEGCSCFGPANVLYVSLTVLVLDHSSLQCSYTFTKAQRRSLDNPV
ncbi:hypothetical protein CROQUDRAFT_103495 [Cronartium quercuum f. sp. fusiforme G11]|uniref:Uncharacterized protein n=1 Tax=Cronartium quercuum f. sp. fusiforme G11 TaxID=708437 RepID=A0A9P6NYI7_9BASI|nr:hypothetical protein CROQUDRAFT_103495 [Cronartium quercuum f. sp. fusiforme G11]